jgi:hypothetical protein
MKLNIILTSLLILLIYSSEMNFMPNYADRPDKWHLLYPMLIFYSILIFNLGWAIFKKNIGSQKMRILISTITTIIGFAMLNNPKGNSQIIGYCIILIVFIISILLLFIKPFPHAIKNGK